jgi:hypothetical protein
MVYVNVTSCSHNTQHKEAMIKAIKKSVKNNDISMNCPAISSSICDEMDFYGYDIECLWIYNTTAKYSSSSQVFVNRDCEWSSFSVGDWSFDIAM